MIRQPMDFSVAERQEPLINFQNSMEIVRSQFRSSREQIPNRQAPGDYNIIVQVCSVSSLRRCKPNAHFNE